MSPEFWFAWLAACRHVLTDGQARWHYVFGPLSALVATMTGFGWGMKSCDLWEAPSREWSLALDLSAPLQPCVDVVLDTVWEKLWCNASLHYCGKGLALEGVAKESFALLRTFRSKSDPVSAGALECLLPAGFWLPDRILEHIGEEISCPLGCGEVGVGPLHVLWTCPQITEVYKEQTAVIDSQNSFT